MNVNQLLILLTLLRSVPIQKNSTIKPSLMNNTIHFSLLEIDLICVCRIKFSNMGEIIDFARGIQGYNTSQILSSSCVHSLAISF